jgi:Spy/CpxP family protein refolding chaperone
MAIRNRVRAVVLGSMAVALFAAFALGAQEPPKNDGAAAPPVAKKVYDPSRRVPDFFGQIGLTPAQREDIYKIRAKHQHQIDELEKQVAKLRLEMVAECETVLTDTQKELLNNLRKVSAEAKAARKKEQAKAKAPVDGTKTAEKPSN